MKSWISDKDKVTMEICLNIVKELLASVIPDDEDSLPLVGSDCDCQSLDQDDLPCSQDFCFFFDIAKTAPDHSPGNSQESCSWVSIIIGLYLLIFSEFRLHKAVMMDPHHQTVQQQSPHQMKSLVLAWHCHLLLVSKETIRNRSKTLMKIVKAWLIRSNGKGKVLAKILQDWSSTRISWWW